MTVYLHPQTSPKRSKNFIEGILIRNVVKNARSGAGMSKPWGLTLVTSLKLSFPGCNMRKVFLPPDRVVVRRTWARTRSALHKLSSTLEMYVKYLTLLFLTEMFE